MSNEKLNTPAFKDRISMNNQTIVPAIASFSISGEIVPLYIRIGSLSVPIERIVWRKKISDAMENYGCEVMAGDRYQQIELLYHSREMVWSIKNTNGLEFGNDDWC